MEVAFFIFTIILIAITVIILARLAYMIYVVSQGPFFARTSDKRLSGVLQLAKKEKVNNIVDLGCGDGKIAIALGKEGVPITGVEIDPYYVWRAKRNVKEEGLENLIKIEQADMWKKDLSSFDLVIVYGIKHVMPRLEEKLMKELKDGSRVISVYFKFPTWEIEDELDEVRLYRKGG